MEKTPDQPITLVCCGGLAGYSYAADLSQTPEFAEWFGKDVSRRNALGFLVQEVTKRTRHRTLYDLVYSVSSAPHLTDTPLRKISIIVEILAS
jgi:hypothetical protein